MKDATELEQGDNLLFEFLSVRPSENDDEYHRKDQRTRVDGEYQHAPLTDGVNTG